MEELAENTGPDPVLLYGEYHDDFVNYLRMEYEFLEKSGINEFLKIAENIIKALDKSKLYILNSLGDGVDWINTSRPLTLKDDLKNKILVLDFFTYCCMNCIHILPLLKKIEKKYSQNSEVVVIGVHSPKFTNEKSLSNVKEAILRNQIEHPVINDPGCFFWKLYSISCWPSILIVGPSGQILFHLIGERQIEKLPLLCDFIVEYYISQGTKLNLSSIPQSLLKVSSKYSLLYPGNISTYGPYILISDTCNNRLLLLSNKNLLTTVIGSGEMGFTDGSFSKASFNAPHGTAWLSSSAFFVADTGNHSIRKVDLETKWVSTVFKTDLDRGPFYSIVDNKPVLSDDIDAEKYGFWSPWDVCIGPNLGSDLRSLNTLYIAVAGSHQIWSASINSDDIRNIICTPFSGSGKEEMRNNSYRYKASFAQPSGITYSKLIPEYLFVADSESSSIRCISMKDGSVKTVVGGGLDPLDLFQFGDVDGKAANVKLQHPLSVCVVTNQTLAIADTYNNKIKLLTFDSNLSKRNMYCNTLNINTDLKEPSGICLSGNGTLLVADTNNHCIKEINLDTNAVNCISISDEPDAAIGDKVLEIQSIGSSTDNVTEANIRIKHGGQIKLYFQINYKSSYQLTENCMQPWGLTVSGGEFSILCKSNVLFGKHQPALVLHSVNAGNEDQSLVSTVQLHCNLQLCDEISKSCASKTLNFKFNVEHLNSACDDVKVNLVGII